MQAPSEASSRPEINFQAHSTFRGHAVPFTPTPGTQCLSRTSGQDAGTQCLSRLRRTHSVFSRLRRAHSAFRGPPVRTRARSAFRAYGGHAVPFAPTAGTQCLSRLRRSLRKQTARSLLSAPYGKPYRSKAGIFIKATIAAPPHVGNRSIKYRRTQSREFQDWVLAVY